MPEYESPLTATFRRGRTLRVSSRKRERSTKSNRATRYSRSKTKRSTDRNSVYCYSMRADIDLNAKVYLAELSTDTFPRANLKRIINVTPHDFITYFNLTYTRRFLFSNRKYKDQYNLNRYRRISLQSILTNF